MDQVEVPSQLSDAGDVAGLTAELVTLAAAKLRLFQTPFNPGPHNVIADFTAALADFTGYADAVLTFSAVGIGADGDAVSYTSRAFFQATDAAAPNEIGGAWLELAGGTLVRYWKFNPPIAMNAALDSIAIVGRVRYRGDTTLDVQA